MRQIVLILIVFVLTVCCGGNQYGYAREYAPLSEEKPYYKKAENAGYEEVRRDPIVFLEKLITWYGVVTKVDEKALPDGRVKVSMTLRIHQQRHLCENEFESSCRVTVSERSGGPFTALMKIRPEDSEGAKRIYTGSLLNIYGVPNGDFDDEGGPVLNARYYRHWPRGAYVTTAWKGNMRR